MLSQELISNTDAREQEAQFNFSRIISILRNSDLDYRLVGGVALLAYEQEPSSWHRPNGTLRDLDIIVLNHPHELDHVFNLQQKLADLTRLEHASFPPIDIHPTYPADKSRPSRLPQLLRRIVWENDGRFNLQYGKISVPIPAETLVKRTVYFNNQEVPTFPPATLLHFYLTRGAYLKPKDIRGKGKLSRFARFTHQHPELSPPHRAYQPFHRFAKEVRQAYPWRTRTFRFINCLDEKFAGRLTHNQFTFGHWHKV